MINRPETNIAPHKIPDAWTDRKLADFLRNELTRIPDDCANVSVTLFIFRRMAEIVIGTVQRQ